MLRLWPSKYPIDKKGREFDFYICRIDTQEELEDLWIHKSGPFLEEHGLWQASDKVGQSLLGETLPRGSLADFARRAIEIDFFSRFPNTGQYTNYHRWKHGSLEGQLNGHEKPLLVQREGYIDILDGFGRLLPYLALVLQGSKFFPFEAYLAKRSSSGVVAGGERPNPAPSAI